MGNKSVKPCASMLSVFATSSQTLRLRPIFLKRSSGKPTQCQWGPCASLLWIGVPKSLTRWTTYLTLLQLLPLLLLLPRLRPSQPHLSHPKRQHLPHHPSLNLPLASRNQFRLPVYHGLGYPSRSLAPPFPKFRNKFVPRVILEDRHSKHAVDAIHPPLAHGEVLHLQPSRSLVLFIKSVALSGKCRNSRNEFNLQDHACQHQLKPLRGCLQGLALQWGKTLFPPLLR